MLVMLKLECKNVNYENEINIYMEFICDNNYGTPCISPNSTGIVYERNYTIITCASEWTMSSG